MKIAMLTLVVGESYARAVSEGTASKKEYCELAGIDFIVDSNHHIPEWPIPWSKLPSIKKYLSQYDAIFHCDADVLITNYAFDIQQMLEIFWEDDKDLLINSELQFANNGLLSNTTLNTGNFFIRNTPWAHDLIDIWLSLENFKDDEFWEQSAFNYLYKASIEVRKKTGLVNNQHLFNSFGSPFVNGWVKGDFLLHAGRWESGAMLSTFYFLRQFGSDLKNWRSDLIGRSVFLDGIQARLSEFGLCKDNNGSVLGEWFACGEISFLIHPAIRRVRPDNPQKSSQKYKLIENTDDVVMIKLVVEQYWWAYTLMD